MISFAISRRLAAIGLAVAVLAACTGDDGDRIAVVLEDLKMIEPGTSAARLRGKTYEEHFARCWEVPADLEVTPLEGQGVEISSGFGPDGSAIKVEVVDKDRVARDPAFRTLAESLRLAVERCGLPPRPVDDDADHYVLMHVLKMRLDPSRMLAAR